MIPKPTNALKKFFESRFFREIGAENQCINEKPD